MAESDYIGERIAEGVFKPVNPEITSRCLLGMVHYYVLLREILGDDTLNAIDDTEAIETIVNLFCQGIMAQPVEVDTVSGSDTP